MPWVGSVCSSQTDKEEGVLCGEGREYGELLFSDSEIHLGKIKKLLAMANGNGCTTVRNVLNATELCSKMKTVDFVLQICYHRKNIQ